MKYARCPGCKRNRLVVNGANLKEGATGPRALFIRTHTLRTELGPRVRCDGSQHVVGPTRFHVL